MRLIALAGNPNVGKSTLFNALTGKNQHTGNWPGKTVELAQGQREYKGKTYRFADLPGTYSLISRSPEERVAEEFLTEGGADCTVAVCDATWLERSLILALQVRALCPRMVLCVNLLDEAQRAGLEIELSVLERAFRAPVVGTSVSDKTAPERLMEAVRSVCEGFAPQWEPSERTALRGENEAASDAIARRYVRRAQTLAERCVNRGQQPRRTLTDRLDRVFLHRIFGYGVLLLLLLGVFWLTIEAANYPSALLQAGFDRLGLWLRRLCAGLPPWLHGALLDGIYATAARVIAVMLPPMAIFFPLFTLLEDFGYLPRVAFLLDEGFRRSGACGKQALTMCMGFGCNAAGVTGCRIVDQPRERLMAIVTNSLVPCNGRFPALIFLISLSFSGGSALLGAGLLTLCVALAVGMTLLSNRLLHRTVLRGEPSAFVLEMPPYRRPRVWQVLVRSVKDRTLRILARAVIVAAPAGLLIWLLANCRVGGVPLLRQLSELLEAPAALLGLNGAVLLAFLLGSPANELVLPVLMMTMTAAGTLPDSGSAAMAALLGGSGWTWQLSLCTLVFFLFHWPCTTTLLTVRRETHSRKWTLLALALPTALGCLLCAALHLILSCFG